MSFDSIKKYAMEIADLPYDTGQAIQILVKNDGRIIGTIKGADFSDLKESDIRDMSGLAFPEIKVLTQSKNMGAMVIFKTPYVGACIDSMRELPAVLDDMAQIIGHKVKIADYDENKIKRALHGVSAVMIKDGYAITIGRNLYEAYVAMTVFEKSAEVFLKAEVLGGARSLNAVEAKLMRLVYMRKYSAKEREAKDELDG